MLQEGRCTSKEEIPYVYITKDNAEEFIKKYCEGQYEIIFHDNHALVKREYSTWMIGFERYMVYDEEGWHSYSKEAFNENYKITVL